MSLTPPDRTEEILLARRFGIVVGIDEVGRGAVAGPVCVGAVAVGEAMAQQPEGLTDSKRLSAKRRISLIEPIYRWALAGAVGWSSPAEVDERGIIACLRLAAWRAVRAVNAELSSGGVGTVGAVLLDGNHNWFTPPARTLLDAATGEHDDPLAALPVVTKIKADLHCSAVSAASILAKVERDTYMEHLPDCGYHWSSNKGYASAAHREALVMLGPSEHHRRSWDLLGTGR